MAELAEQLGITEPTLLASAIKPLVDPTKASALLDASPEETGTSSEKGEAKKMGLVDILIEDERKNRKLRQGAEGALGWMETVVGMDEPPSEMPV